MFGAYIRLQESGLEKPVAKRGLQMILGPSSQMWDARPGWQLACDQTTERCLGTSVPLHHWACLPHSHSGSSKLVDQPGH